MYIKYEKFVHIKTHFKQWNDVPSEKCISEYHTWKKLIACWNRDAVMLIVLVCFYMTNSHKY